MDNDKAKRIRAAIERDNSEQELDNFNEEKTIRLNRHQNTKKKCLLFTTADPS